MNWLGNTTLRKFGDLTPREFLRDYWQQKPLFIRNAVPEIPGLLDGGDLAGLALDEQVESRIVLKHPDDSWELRRGPFKTKTFKSLPARDWTLLVQAVDHYLPAAAELLERFNFLPHWRIDDLMVSYAVDGGGVGPHYDSYDVFLIQGIGTRVWKIGPEVSDKDLLPHQDLRILKKMTVSETFICEPGDLLYLPPRLAHWGVAHGECMTYSVGFRAPGDRELLDGFCNYLLERIPEAQRYGDAGARPTRHPGQLDAQAIAVWRRRLRALIEQPQVLEDFLGRWLSEAKYAGHATDAPAKRWTRASLAKSLAAATFAHRDEGSRFLLLNDPPLLFVDGEGIALEAPAAIDLATLIADSRLIPANSLHAMLTDPAAAALLLRLFNSGHLYLPETGTETP